MPIGVPILDSGERGHHHIPEPHPLSDLFFALWRPGAGTGGRRLAAYRPGCLIDEGRAEAPRWG